MTIFAASKILEPLASELRFAGDTLKQVFRQNCIAIYTRGRPNSEPHELELVVIRQKKAGILPNGTVVPEREAYPSNSEWGKWAWSFPIRERDFVFGIAARMAQMEGPLGTWVRQQVTSHKRSLKTPNLLRVSTADASSNAPINDPGAFIFAQERV